MMNICIKKLFNKRFFSGFIFTFLLLLFTVVLSEAYSKVLLDYLSPYGNIIALVSANFNADGDGEVAFISGNQLKLYAVNSQGELFYISNAISGTQLIDVEKLDINNDGTYDVATCSEQAISVFDVSSGNTSPSYTVSYPQGYNFQTVLKLGDPNGDLITDIIIGCQSTSNPNRSRVYVYRSNSGILTYNSGNLNGRVNTIAVNDVNGDGFDDVAVGMTSGRVYLLGGGPANFSSVWNVTDPNGRSVGKIRFIPDRNGDGRKEVVVGTAGQLAGTPDAVRILSGANGAQLSSYSVSGMGKVTSLKVADLDGDAIPEIVVGTGKFRNSSGNLVNDDKTRILSSTLPLSIRAETGTFSGENYIIDADFDGDTFSEIAVSHSNLVTLYGFSGSSLILEEETTACVSDVTVEEQLDIYRFNADDEVYDLVRGAVSGEIKAISFYEEVIPFIAKLKVSNVRVIDRTVYPGDTNVLIDVYKLNPEEDATLTSVRVRKAGNIPDSSFKNLRLYQDDGSNSFEVVDEIISTATISGTYADFAISKSLSSDTTTTLFLVIDLDEQLPLGESFFFSVDTNSDILATLMETTGVFPLVSAQFLISDLVPPVTILEKNIPVPDGNNGWYKSALVISLSSNKPGTTYYWFNDETPKVYVEKIVCPQGINTVHYYSVDLYGNKETTRSEILKVDIVPPEVPQGVVASAKSPNSIQISWRASLDKEPGSGVSIYKVYRDKVLAGIVPSGETSFLDTGLRSNTEYRYEVVAEDAAGNESARSKTVIGKTPEKPVVIENLRVISGSGKNTIYWESIESTEISSIDIQRSAPDSGTSGWHKINSLSLPPDTTYFEDLLSPGEEDHIYYYQLVLKDSENKVLTISKPVGPSKVQVSKLITTSGGSISPSTGELKLEIPSGSLSENTLIVAESVTTALPSGRLGLSRIYDLGPDGLSFTLPATLTISFKAPERIDKSLVSIGQYSNGSWTFIETDVNTTRGVATALVDHFSLFGVFFFGTELDTTPPVISVARSASPNKLFITFSEFMDTTSLLSLSNYTVSEATVTSVTAFSDGKSAVLQTTYLEPLSEHTVTVVNVKDLAGNFIVDDGVGNVATFTVSSEPHGKYLDDTNKCSLCHKVHGAKTPTLLVKQSATEVCYLCHDEIGTGSKYNTGSSYVSTLSASIHYSRSGDENVFCTDCHSPHKNPANVPRLLRLRSENTTQPLGESFCFSCHSPDKGLPEYQWVNETSYTTSSHYNLLPGSSSGTGITCMHCHQSHSSSLLSLLRGNVEEFTCISCHRENGTSPESEPSITSLSIYSCLINSPEATVGLPGFEATRTVWYKHPVLEVSGKHTLMELFDSTEAAQIQNSTETRHAECSDCHNPHHARRTLNRNAPFAPESLTGISGVQVLYTTGSTIPAFTFIPYNLGIIYEYELCFKCHSSFAKSSYGSDLASVMSPNNTSYHPVVSTGKNETTYMANNLLPPYTTDSQIYCSSCHSCSETTSPVGAHGSEFPFILKANYRFGLKETSPSDNYDANDFAICYGCHRSEPYEDVTGQQRLDSNFRFHGLHLRLLYNDPASGLEGGILTPGAGKGNAVCRECHYNPHGSGNERLVNFAPNVLGPNGEIGGANWSLKTEETSGTCYLKCHGYIHNPKTY